MRRSVSYADKSVLNVRHGEERELSEQLHKNLELLNVIHPRHFNFQSCFKKDMFLKPNSKAFPHVMHYLFNILDPDEFKKRFHWPLDRSSENDFRTKTVQYLNYLNEKHHLGWEEIKAFLVVMPGGKKFMKLLLNLIDFLVDEETKKVEKSLPDNFDRNALTFTQETVRHIVQSNENFVNKSVKYKETIEEQKAIIVENSNQLNMKLNEFLRKVNMPIEQIDEEFFRKFASNNYDLFETIIKQKVDKIEENNVYLDKLNSQLDEFFNEKQQFQGEKNILVASYKNIQKHFSDDCPSEILTKDNKIQLSSVFNAFNCIFPALENALGQLDVTTQRIENYEFEINEVDQLLSEALQLDSDIYKLEHKIDELKTDSDDILASARSEQQNITPNRSCSTPVDTSLKLKYIYTPAVDMQNNDNTKPRLALLENSMDRSFSFANQTMMLASRSIAGKNSSFYGANSKIKNAVSLLRTVTKSTARKKHQQIMNATNMATIVLRKNEKLFADEKENLSTTIITDSKDELYQQTTSDSKQKNTDGRQAIREKLMDNPNITISPDYLLLKKRQKIKSDQDGNMKSPAGRLEPLVKIDHNFDAIKVVITDASLNESDMLDSFSIEDNTIKELGNTMVEKCNVKDAAYGDEIVEFCLDFERKLGFNAEKESIFNVSDTLLKDISH